MMFLTRRSLARTLDTAARADWRLLAAKHQFQETLLPPYYHHHIFMMYMWTIKSIETTE